MARLESFSELNAFGLELIEGLRQDDRDAFFKRAKGLEAVIFTSTVKVGNYSIFPTCKAGGLGTRLQLDSLPRACAQLHNCPSHTALTAFLK